MFIADFLMVQSASILNTETHQPEGPEVRERILAFLRSQHQSNLEKNLEELLTLDGGFVERFHFFMPLIDETAKERLLISGCSAGSELLVARRFGFQELFGTEVTKELVDIARMRLQSGMMVDLYDGSHLPYKDNSFSMIYSGHVIEHTPSPRDYFAEHLRVLRPGGYFFLEFPNRYHTRELHTGLPSLEWLPLALRNKALSFMASSFSPAKKHQRPYYDLVRRTLQPVSVWQIRKYLRDFGTPRSRIIAIQMPAPGFVRMLLYK